VQNMTRKLAAAVMAVAATGLLAGCGAGTASHVVQGTAPPTTPGVTATTVVTPVPTAPSSSSAGLDPQTINQVDADLGNLDDNLAQVNTDLNSPQGDS
jgi:hypothetical protein